LLNMVSSAPRGRQQRQKTTKPAPVSVQRRGLDLETYCLRGLLQTTLPSGQDPDDLIRQDPARWAALVDEAAPLVEHYMRTILQGQDLDDPKIKAEITQSLVPVIRQVSSPVERAHYAQKLARTLRVDERALLNMVSSAPRGRQQRQKTTKPAPVSVQRRGLDLETYCLRGLLQTTLP